MAAAIVALRRHWPEYLIEGAGLGLFMISAGLVTTLLEHPGSWVHREVADPFARRALIGVAMGLTAVGLIYSPWGKQSGAHLNPAVTLTFLRLGKVAPWDAGFYMAAQVAGGTAGVLFVLALLGDCFALAPVSFVATLPGLGGQVQAFAAELAISFGLMLTVLFSGNTPRLMRFTGLFAGMLVALYITFEAPFSGMSMNPARTAASSIPSGLWVGGWIYWTAPPLGMLLAAEAYRLLRRVPTVFCAKLSHDTDRRCIFRCGYHAAGSPVEHSSPADARLRAGA